MAPHEKDELRGQPRAQVSRAAGWSMHDVLRALANGEIAREEAFAQLMALHELGAGAAVEALRYLDAILAEQFAQAVGRDMAGSVRRMSEPNSKAELPSRKPTDVDRFHNKNSQVLQREYLLLRALTKANHEVPSAALLHLVASFDSSVKGPTVTAHLDRLFRDGLISRPRKGLYGTTTQSSDYLKAIAAELRERGESLPSAG